MSEFNHQFIQDAILSPITLAIFGEKQFYEQKRFNEAYHLDVLRYEERYIEVSAALRIQIRNAVAERLLEDRIYEEKLARSNEKMMRDVFTYYANVGITGGDIDRRTNEESHVLFALDLRIAELNRNIVELTNQMHAAVAAAKPVIEAEKWQALSNDIDVVFDNTFNKVADNVHFDILARLHIDYEEISEHITEIDEKIKNLQRYVDNPFWKMNILEKKLDALDNLLKNLEEKANRGEGKAPWKSYLSCARIYDNVLEHYLKEKEVVKNINVMHYIMQIRNLKSESILYKADQERIKQEIDQYDNLLNTSLNDDIEVGLLSAMQKRNEEANNKLHTVENPYKQQINLAKKEAALVKKERQQEFFRQQDNQNISAQLGTPRNRRGIQR